MQGFGLARLGRDAELRSTPNGTSVINLALAFTRRAQGGEKLTDWVEGVLWGKRAEALAPHLLKGGLVSVTLNNVRIETYQSAKGAGHKLIGEVIEIELAGGGQQAAPAPKPTPKPAAKQASGHEFDDLEDAPF